MAHQSSCMGLRMLRKNWLTRLFKRNERARFNEFDYLRDLLASVDEGVIVDVGACHGHLVSLFLEMGWYALAVEPDELNRQQLLSNLKGSKNLAVDGRAITTDNLTGIPFYRSSASIGISSLNRFHRDHKFTGVVDTVTLERLLLEHNLRKIDLLKVDAEGEDLSVLRSLNMNEARPSVIFIEWNNIPEFQKRNSPRSIANHLLDAGYLVHSFEWHPVIEYGQSHSFKGVRNIRRESKFGARNWGNFLAIDSGVKCINREYERYIDFNLAWDKIISRIVTSQARSRRFNNVYIWGRGKGARRLLKRYPSLRFVSYVESEIRSSERCFDNRVITPDLIPDRSTVIIASSFQRQIRESVARYGLSERSRIIFVPFTFLASSENV